MFRFFGFIGMRCDWGDCLVEDCRSNTIKKYLYFEKCLQNNKTYKTNHSNHNLKNFLRLTLDGLRFAFSNAWQMLAMIVFMRAYAEALTEQFPSL